MVLLVLLPLKLVRRQSPRSLVVSYNRTWRQGLAHQLHVWWLKILPVLTLQMAGHRSYKFSKIMIRQAFVVGETANLDGLSGSEIWPGSTERIMTACTKQTNKLLYQWCLHQSEWFNFMETYCLLPRLCINEKSSNGRVSNLDQKKSNQFIVIFTTRCHF